VERDVWEYPYREGIVVPRLFAPLRAQVADLLAAALSPVPWDVVVDIGCGNGILSGALSNKLTHPARWVLIDRDRQLLAEAHRGTARADRHVVSLAADLDALPLASCFPESNVLVLASHVLYYATSWRRFMRLLTKRLTANRRPHAVAIVLRSPRSDSYLLRRTVRLLGGETEPRMLHGDVLGHWLAAGDLPWTHHRVSTTYRPATGTVSGGPGWMGQHDDELRNALELLCHTDPLKLPPPTLLELQRMISRDGPELPPVIRLEDDVFVVRNDACAPLSEEHSASH
jgi:SAM-dependent methyltransferase